MTIDKEKWVCARCGGLNIEEKVWVDANDDTVLDNATEDDQDRWCRDCEDNVDFVLESEFETNKD